jgi:phage terminase large subunit GpA-like protein
MEQPDYSVIRGFFEGIRPTPRISVAEWSDQHRMLSSTAASEPGKWRTSRTPYLREIFEFLSANHPAKRLAVMKGAQLGFTEAGMNWLGYIIDIAPAPTLIVQPTVDISKRNSKMRVEPMIEATARLREKIKPSTSRAGGNTILQKDFAGGTVIFGGANSAAGLRSMPIKNLMLDELDAYPQDLEGEGSPAELARARQRTFARSKELDISTPTVEGVSAIEKLFLASDQRYFFVPCPHCGDYQKLTWDRLKWEENQPETVAYQCISCDELIEERYKTDMLAAGEWRATAPENANPEKFGYHINSLYSPYGWYSWQQAVEDWEAAQNDTPALKTFVNTVLGETWKEKGDSPPWENLYNRREDYPINKPSKDVAFITAGADVQKDRIEVEIVGWCEHKISYSLDFRVLHGDTEKTDVWDLLASVVDEQFEREDGAMLPVKLMAVDSGFNTQYVYDFCRRFDSTRVIPTKGQGKQAVVISAPKTVDVTINGNKVGNVKLFNIGVSILKSELYGWLKLENIESDSPPVGYCFFPQYAPEYFKGLTAEQLQLKRNKDGHIDYAWIKKYERNEPLDCRVYARAAAELCGLTRLDSANWNRIRNEYVTRKKETVTNNRKRAVSDYWDR